MRNVSLLKWEWGIKWKISLLKRGGRDKLLRKTISLDRREGSIFPFIFLWGFVEAKTDVLVSILPQKFLVERIGGEEVEVAVIVPAGANAHTYEPTPKQIAAIQKGEIWFRIGENFEHRLLPLMAHAAVVDQREGLDLIETNCGCCLLDAHDPHIWLSPKLLKKQATQIADILGKNDPDHHFLFSNNLRQLIGELDLLDQECQALLFSPQPRLILVSTLHLGTYAATMGLNSFPLRWKGENPLHAIF